MDYLCRFCLKVTKNEICKLQESNILSKIQSCLSIQITIEESFPNNLCKDCTNKIDEINEFCSTIQENQEKLRQFLIDGSLQNYYLKVTNNIHVKAEVNECRFVFESKNDNSISNGLSKREINKNINTDNIAFIECENIKTEESAIDDCNDNTFSSDDEVMLSSIKKENVHKASEKPKKINRPQQNVKKKKKHETQNTYDQNIDDKQFTCLTCLQLFESQTDLLKHYTNDHLNKYKINIKQNYTKLESDGNIVYKCDSCEKTCHIRKDIVKHVATHNEERPLICKLCGRTYKTVTEINRHARVHNGFKLQCSYKCGYTTAYQGALKEHENRHLDAYKYTCQKCGKGFYVKTWYEQHQNIHTGLKPFVCDICGLAFHMDRYLTAHKSTIHPQSSNVKRYICVHCNQKCDSANSLAIHLEEHGINKEKEFLCDFCGKILSSADQLKNHHRMHSGVKPYSCSICNKSFAKKFNVKIHMSSHLGEKSHACTRCGKRYTQRSTLLRHLKRHHTPGSSPKRTR